MSNCDDRRLAGRELAEHRWRQLSTEQRKAATAAGRRAWRETFERLVDPDLNLTPGERAERARELRRLHMAELSARGVAARRARRLAELREKGQPTREQRSCAHRWAVANRVLSCTECAVPYVDWMARELVTRSGGAA